MRLFVTGATGFIGSHFANQAAQKGHHVIALRRPGSRPPIALPSTVMWIDGELDGFNTECLRSCDTIVHFAAAGVRDLSNWKLCFETNVIKSIALFESVVREGLRNFLIAGSCFEYGLSCERHERVPTDAMLMPTDAYHASKASATMAAIAFCIKNRLRLTILRPFHVYGKGEAQSRFWPSMTEAARNGQDFLMTAGRQVRDFIPVETVAAEFLAEAHRLPTSTPGCPHVRNVGTGRAQSLAVFAAAEWARLNATGELKIGAISDRKNEIYRCVPEISE